ncbi:putative thiamine transporter SLC35F3, partial [Caerostris darwini]
DPQLDHSDLNQVQSNHCCTGRARRTAVGFILAVIMCTTWIGMTHLFKWAYIIHLQPFNCNCTLVNESHSLIIPSTAILEMGPNTSAPKLVTEHSDDKDPDLESFKAPFLMTWFCTACNCLFFPVYLCTRFCSRRTRITARRSILEAMRRFREKGLSIIHFLTRSIFFLVLWVGTNYMLIYTIDKLDATAVMALQTSRTSFVYLLSWVILHEQFVGIRIVAVILCNTGIALLAYMDGVAKTSTLGGVVMASAASAGLSVHKVLFKKLIGRVTIGQLSIFLTLVGLLNILLLWPIGLTLYLLESEKIIWNRLPYGQLAGSAAFFITGNVLGNFDIAHNYNTYLSIGMLAAVPVSAVLDARLHNVVFEGMKLAGILLICIGFLLVLLPDNWPDYITRLVRWRCRRIPKSKPADPSQPKARRIFMRPS